MTSVKLADLDGRITPPKRLGCITEGNIFHIENQRICKKMAEMSPTHMERIGFLVA